MRVQFSVVGQVEHLGPFWADLPAVPQEGDVIDLPGLSQADTVVRTVVWYPFGDEDGGESEPFVYIVVGSPRS